MSNEFYQLQVVSVSHPIKEATTITFNVPPHLLSSFTYHPGQHLVIKFIINGEEARRSYSLNSNPFEDETLEVTIKRVRGGLVSNYVGDHLKAGEELSVMMPQGRFYANVEEDAYKTYFLFAAGSGITPIISILKSVLAASPNSSVNLLYGNSNQDTIIFKEELDELLNQYPERLQIVHTLSAPNIWSSWKQWDGEKGRINGEAIERFITNHPPIAQSTEYYICGPGAMNVEARDTLISLQIPKELIHIEQFGGDVKAVSKEINAVDNAQLKATINHQDYQLCVPKGKTLLEALKDANANPPYSCQSGICGTCTAKIVSGKAEMKSSIALDESEIAAGIILTCQALPTTASIAIEYKEVT